MYFKDNIGAFLYLAPLSEENDAGSIKQAFDILDSLNKNKDVSRIENVEEEDLFFYRKAGYDCRVKSCDYLCRRAELADLKGNKFKSKRASRNYFTKNYRFECVEFSLRYKDACLKLYDAWAAERGGKNSDSVYCGMLKDSRKCLEVLLDSYKDLGIGGRLVLVENKLKGFTFGFKLNKDTFCILYEVAELSAKGLAQFIFSEFCRGLKGYKYINVMDDSGLENLKKVKLSYHPARLIPAYIAKRDG